MPRHTRVRAKAKHSRAEIRHQRARWTERRWQRLKSGERIQDAAQHSWDRNDWLLCRWSYRPLDEEEQALADALGQSGPFVSVHPELARRLPLKQQLFVSTPYDTLTERLHALPRRLSYRGRKYDGWGWDHPKNLRFALTGRHRHEQRWRAEVEEELWQNARVMQRYLDGSDCSILCGCERCEGSSPYIASARSTGRSGGE
jgi:hypothetical protein